VVRLPWWGDVLFVLAVLTAIWGFISLAGLNTRILTRRTDRRAEDLYADYAGTAPRHRRHGRDPGAGRPG
jgi:hypothetical protein